MTEAVYVSLGMGLLTAIMSAAASFGAVKYALGSLTSRVQANERWLTEVSEGKTEHVGRINATIENHTRIQTEHGQRLSKLEYDIGPLSRRGREDD